MRITFLLLALFISSFIYSQKILQIERFHSPKTQKFYPGNEVTFQINTGEWYTRFIEDLSYENNWLLFGDGHMELDKITAIKTFKNAQWSKGLGNRIMMFAPVWGVYTGISSAVDDEVDFGFQKSDYVIMGSAVATGLLLRLLFKSKTYKFAKNGKKSNKFRLRILDLDIR